MSRTVYSTVDAVDLNTGKYYEVDLYSAAEYISFVENGGHITIGSKDLIYADDLVEYTAKDRFKNFTLGGLFGL